MSKQRFEHKHDDTLERADTVQRLEIITGVGRRRRFSREAKASIVLESHASGAVVSEVARRHGLTPQQLFGWRRELRSAISGSDAPAAAGSNFTPVVIEGSSSVHQQQVVTRARPTTERGLIEITIGEVVICLRDGVAPRTITAVLQAVKATS
jgi:transposase